MNSINVSEKLRELAISIITIFPKLDYVNLDKVGFFIVRSKNLDSNKALSKIVARLEAPKGSKLSYFLSDIDYMSFYHWPSYFNLNKRDKIRIIIYNLLQISRECDGNFRDRKMLEPIMKKSLEFTKKIENNSTLKNNLVLKYDATQLEKKATITASSVSIPRIVISDNQ